MRRLVFSEDGRRLASAEEDDTIRIWETDPKVTLPVLTGHSSYVYPLAYSPDGRTLASGSWDGTVRLWDSRTGECRRVLRHPSASWTLPISRLARLVTGCGEDNILRIWDVSTGNLWKQLPGADKPLDAIAARPGTAEVAAVEREGKICITDVDSGDRLATLVPQHSARLLIVPTDISWLSATMKDASLCGTPGQRGEWAIFRGIHSPSPR